MNGRPVTDTQISLALRAHLPAAAPAGLRERVLDAAATTAQVRPFPSFLGALSDADPIGRRRSLLIAAALLLALALASATAVGAWRLLQQNPIDELSLEPPTDLPAFVLSSYERLPHLPPVALTWRNSDSTKGRIYVDRSGAVRFDQFASADATEPSAFQVLSGNRISGVATVGSDKVWVDDDGAIENPRNWIGSILHAPDGPRGCEMERVVTGADDSTAATGWRYVGLEYIAGRPTHHVTCGGGDIWLDIETRLILRTQGPPVDDAGQPIPVESTAVTEIAFGEQPAALFQPPEGLARWSSGDYKAYICARGLPNELVPGISDCPSEEAQATPPPPEPSPTPIPTQPANTSPCAIPSSDPSEPAGPLALTPESQNEDWPAPVRPEPAGGGSVQPIPLTHGDLIGDNGSTAFPCADIRGVMANTSEVHLKLDSSQPPLDPDGHWIAYGVVTDEDRDGVPDWRYGIDNVPFDTAEASSNPSERRWWRTDLHTGRTDAGGMGGGDGDWFGADFKSRWPFEFDDAAFWFNGAIETTQGSQGWGFELDMPFYAWASVIVNGQVVATDYAPDAGWLVATRGASPGGTLLVRDPFPNLAMAVPEGWTSSGEGDLDRVACGDLARHVEPDESYEAVCASVRFEIIAQSGAEQNYPLRDPEQLCDDTIEPPLGSSFDDLATYVAGLPTIVTPEDADVTIDGYRGKHFEYSWVEGDLDCFWDSNDIWILDVDGVRLMIRSQIGGDLDLDVPEEALRAEIQQMVESIHFER
jgi:hypothetical protein